MVTWEGVRGTVGDGLGDLVDSLEAGSKGLTIAGTALPSALAAHSTMDNLLEQFSATGGGFNIFDIAYISIMGGVAALTYSLSSNENKQLAQTSAVMGAIVGGGMSILNQAQVALAYIASNPLGSIPGGIFGYKTASASTNGPKKILYGAGGGVLGAFAGAFALNTMWEHSEAKSIYQEVIAKPTAIIGGLGGATIGYLSSRRGDLKDQAIKISAGIVAGTGLGYFAPEGFDYLWGKTTGGAANTRDFIVDKYSKLRTLAFDNIPAAVGGAAGAVLGAVIPKGKAAKVTLAATLAGAGMVIGYNLQ